MSRSKIQVIDRRSFLTGAAALAAGGLLARPARAWREAPSERVRLAAVGVGGKGWSDINNTAAEGADVVAFCDVETGTPPRRRNGGYGEAAEKWPSARRYTDWRQMLDKEHQNIDGLTVSTPDHMHAPVTMTALQLGLATYTQKPLTRTIHEARRLAEAARERGAVTQMGNQGHSGTVYRTLVHLLQSGAIGKVKEAHAWSDRPKWPQGVARPAGKDAIPAAFHWDLWLGVAADRPFKSGAYHPFNWRGWYDFGAGALGDMGCHIIDPVVWGLELGSATSVVCECPPASEETFPEWEIVRYTFPGTAHTKGDTIEVTWHDGGKQPAAELAPLPPGEKLPSNGTLFIGEKGALLTPHGGGGGPQLLPGEKFADVEMPRLEEVDHYLQWTRAIRGEGSTTSGFDYAGPLTETVLLGTIACRFPGQRLAWNAAAMRFDGHGAASELISAEYRKGWEVKGLA